MNKIIFTVVISIFFICSINGRTDEYKAKIDNYINNLIHSKKVAGVSIAVSKNGNWIFKNNYGYAKIEEKEKVTGDTQFNIMSITKNFIAVAIIKLADENEISLDDPIRKYLANLPLEYDKVLIYQLLNHSAGVPDYIDVNGFTKQLNKHKTPLEILKTVLNKPLQFTPGEKNEYSNSGYFLLGLLIEKITKQKLSKYLYEKFFKPLDMNHTYFEDNLANKELKAQGYINENQKLVEPKKVDPSQYWAAGAIVSTLKDMMKWDDALLTGRILHQKEINQMMQSIKLKDGNLSEYGLGFELMNASDIKIAGNNGTGNGFNAANLFFLNKDIRVIVLTNTSNSNSTMIAKNIYDMINDTANINHKKEIPNQTKKDRLDSVVVKIFGNVQDLETNSQYFSDSKTINSFKKEQLQFVKAQGKLIDVVREGEKNNPQTIVRRYQIKFENGALTWIIIFSKEGKILITNHN